MINLSKRPAVPAKSGLVVTRNPIVLQQAFDALTGLFNRVVLKTNTKKTEAMAFLPSRIYTCLYADTYKAQLDDFYQAGQHGRQVNC